MFGLPHNHTSVGVWATYTYHIIIPLFAGTPLAGVAGESVSVVPVSVFDSRFWSAGVVSAECAEPLLLSGLCAVALSLGCGELY